MAVAEADRSCRLDPQELRRLDDDGYVVRERLFTADEVAATAEACEELVAEVARGRRGHRLTVGSYTFEPDVLNTLMVKWEGDSDVVHGLEPFAHLSPPLAVLALDPRFVEPMIDLVDDPAPMLFTEKLNLKRPRHGGVNPLHQDFPYWSDAADAGRIATAMLFLDDAGVDNGTLEVVPGSHRQGVWATRTDRDPFGNLEIDVDEAGAVGGDQVETVPVEVPAGSVVYFGSLLVHRSAPNRSDRERRALLFSYQPPGAPDLRELLRALPGRDRDDS
jgi:ectoine hydroxylase-related dioxygenase (phytanoyl-CoA dioxygenase family)